MSIEFEDYSIHVIEALNDGSGEKVKAPCVCMVLPFNSRCSRHRPVPFPADWLRCNG